MTLSKLFMAGHFASTLTNMMSMTFLCFFLPMTLLVFTIVPKKIKKYALLVISYGFSWLISGKLAAFLLLSTLSIHYFSLWIERLHRQQADALKAAEKDAKKAIKASFIRKKKGVICFAVILHFGLLLGLKYSAFITVNINSLLRVAHVPLKFDVPALAVPIGISFYTLQGMSYIVDVYRGTIQADDNIGRLALFMSFFPQIVEGPICRYSDTAERLWNVQGIRFENLKLGAQRILWGMVKKMVIADRLNSFVGLIFDHPENYEGGIVAVAAVCYTIQLYMDFSGSIDAAIGVAQIFGVGLPENFRRPFFSKTISEFWQRWHITLGAWFRDYIFYPVTMSRRMKNLTSAARKKIGNYYGPLIAGSIALFCVWLCNGLWHGAAWNYVFFGMYHFAFILCGSLIQPLTGKINKLLHINTQALWFRIFQMLRTTLIVLVGEVFFRAADVKTGCTVLKRIFTNFSFASLGAMLCDSSLMIDAKDFAIIGVTLIIVLVVSFMQERGMHMRESLNKRNIVLRWAILYALILYIVIFGAYGKGYIAVVPVYANF